MRGVGREGRRATEISAFTRGTGIIWAFLLLRRSARRVVAVSLSRNSRLFGRDVGTDVHRDGPAKSTHGYDKIVLVIAFRNTRLLQTS